MKFARNSSKYSCSDGILIEVNSYVKLKFCKVESKNSQHRITKCVTQMRENNLKSVA